MAAAAAAAVAAAAAAAFAADSSAARSVGAPARAVVTDAADSPRISQPQQQQQHARGHFQSRTQSGTLPQPEEAAVTSTSTQVAAGADARWGARLGQAVGDPDRARAAGSRVRCVPCRRPTSTHTRVFHRPQKIDMPIIPPLSSYGTDTRPVRAHRRPASARSSPLIIRPGTAADPGRASSVLRRSSLRAFVPSCGVSAIIKFDCAAQCEVRSMHF